MSIDWDSLESFSDWSDTLNQLLKQVEAALKSGDIAQRTAVQRLLSDFCSHSPDRLAAQLDVIARQTMDDMLNKAIDEALSSIASRSADLAMHAKVISAVAESAERRAASIRLDKAKQVIDSTTSTIVSLTSLRQALGEGVDDKVVVARIDKAVKAIQDLVPLVIRVKGPAADAL